MAAVLIATKGPLARGECLCSARATSSLPEPDSPVIITVTLLCDSRPMARNTSCIAGAWPSISGAAAMRSSATSSRWLSSTARRISSTALGRSKGLGRYSKAPPWKADTALSRSEKAVMMMTGRPGMLFLDLGQQVQAGAARHADVAHQDLRAVVVVGALPAPAAPRAGW